MRKRLPALGKIDPDFFNKVIFPKLGAKSGSVIIGPRHGVDFAAIKVGGKALVISTDPFFIAPALGWEKAAWFAVHILVSDVAVSGIMPTHLCVDLNLPPEMDEEILEKIWSVVHSECEKLGISVISGHTARYAGCNYPMVGGASVFGIGDKKDLRDPGNIKTGDMIVITKGPAIETTGLMSTQFPEFLEEKYGGAFVKKARAIFYEMSTVKDALVASRVKGVVAMHDATECGIWGGLYEMAMAGGWGINVYKDRIILSETVRKVCECFEIMPYSAISEGTMIAVVRRKDAKALVRLLEGEGIPASIAGEVIPKKKGLNIIEGNRSRELVHPKSDPFWTQFEKYLKIQKGKKRLHGSRKNYKD